MTIGDDDLEMFNAATAREPGVPEQETNEPPEKPAVAEPEAKPEGEAEATEAETDTRERDAAGKFVAKKEGEGTEAEAAATRTPDEARKGIPPGRLREEADARRAAEDRAGELQRRLDDMQRQIERLQPSRQPPAQPAQPAPNLFENPDGYLDARLSPFEQKLEDMRESMSRMVATQTHGADAVAAAYKAIQDEVAANPTARFEAARIWKSEHPVEALVQWHKGRETLRQIGSDPAAYQQKLREQLLTDPEFVKQVIERANGTARQAPAAGNGRSATIAIPPSLNSRNGAGADTGRAPAASDAEEFANFFPR